MRVRFSHPALLRSLASFGSFAVHSTRKKKKPRYGGFFTTTLLRELFNSVLQGLGSAELRHPHRLDLNRRTRTRVAACAAGACLRLEDTEARNRDFLATLEGVGNHRDNCLNRALTVSLCAADGLSHSLHQIHFICHMFLLYVY